MYNMLWDKQSGIGNYPISFKDYTYLPARGTVEINRDSFVITSNTSTANLLEVNTRTKVLPSYKVKIEGVSTIKEGNLKWRINTTRLAMLSTVLLFFLTNLLLLVLLVEMLTVVCLAVCLRLLLLRQHNVIQVIKYNR